MKRLTVAIVSLIVLMCGVAYAETDTEFIASVIAAEAGGEGYDGMYAVACVIQNRMALSHKTALQVVKQKNQFFGATAKNRLRNYKDVKATADKIASQIGHLKDTTNGATHFENVKAFGLPYWATKECATIGRHTFFK